MGVIATSLLIVLATLLLSGLSWLAEPLLLPRGADRGPAAGGQWEAPGLELLHADGVAEAHVVQKRKPPDHQSL